MILKGKVKSGLGEASFWMKKAEEAFEKKLGKKMFHGTLNIELENNYILDGNIEVLKGTEYGGTQDVYIKECDVLGHKSYIVRTDHNSSENRTHPLNLIEIISDISFREKYNLKDNDIIEILI
jgi:CTP-dependent riboflavin kinase